MKKWCPVLDHLTFRPKKCIVLYWQLIVVSVTDSHLFINPLRSGLALDWTPHKPGGQLLISHDFKTFFFAPLPGLSNRKFELEYIVTVVSE